MGCPGHQPYVYLLPRCDKRLMALSTGQPTLASKKRDALTYKLTPTEVEDLLIEAVDTINRYQAPPDAPARPKAFWPTTVKEYWTEYGRQRATARRSAPDPEAIDRMDLFMVWLALMIKGYRRFDAQLRVQILFSRANDVSFQIIADRTRYTPKPISKTTAQRYYAECLDKLTRIANESLAA